MARAEASSPSAGEPSTETWEGSASKPAAWDSTRSTAASSRGPGQATSVPSGEHRETVVGEANAIRERWGSDPDSAGTLTVRYSRGTGSPQLVVYSNVSYSLRIVFSVIGMLSGCIDNKLDHGAVAASHPAESSTPGGRLPGSLRSADVQGAWWSWAAGVPSGRNPVEDATGADCAVHQPDKVWFLVGNFGGDTTRRCVVPAGRTLVAPLVNLQGSKRDCTDFMASATGELTIDGVVQRSLRWPGVKITTSAVAGNPITREAGRFSAYACGVWAISRPLPLGRHILTIRGASGGFRVAVRYELTIGRDSTTKFRRV